MIYMVNQTTIIYTICTICTVIIHWLQSYSSLALQGKEPLRLFSVPDPPAHRMLRAVRYRIEPLHRPHIEVVAESQRTSSVGIGAALE